MLFIIFEKIVTVRTNLGWVEVEAGAQPAGTAGAGGAGGVPAGG